MAVYVVGQINIIDLEKWLEYKKQVINTLEPFGGKVLFRGSLTDSFVGETPYPEIVAIEFESPKLAKDWFKSETYQAIVETRQKGANIILNLYE
ncbi:DUF1330 domain-containing protein [Aliarcobacter butzleri]|uniref:DUF1330 domain-containing protein n=1 Tax=Aliarcobacter butzleri TaxID=28197 RepID=UPI001EDBA968|nr:DUF1330 domain-containing protein [Aliarcobacter butzleri]MCG3650803.1 DUF1330 domain-containing protein [Aliarcobacter butzleri]